MKTIILFFFCVRMLSNPITDLERFAGAGNSHVLVIYDLQSLKDRIRFDQSKECPEMLILLFSIKGARNSIKASSRQELYLEAESWPTKLKKGQVVCVLIKDHIYRWQR